MEVHATPEGIVVSMTNPEADMLSDLVEQTIDILEQRAAFSDDPAIRRLLPDAYRGSTEDAAEFRRLVESDIVEAKGRNATLVLDDLSVHSLRGIVYVTLDEESVQAWLRMLADVRVFIGARLGIDGDNWEPSREVANSFSFAAFSWLAELQAGILEEL
jgi:hypothetical protein